MALRIFSPEEIQDIIYSYTAQNMSMLKLAKRYGCSNVPIRRVLIENNIPIRNDNRFYRSYPIKEDYFEVIDNQNKAYLLGYTYADGCVTKGNNVSYASSKENIESLEIVKKELNSPHKICEYYNKTSYSTGPGYKLSIVNQKLYDDLIKQGVVPRKSLICDFPKESQVPKELIPHFIRGYFDGNGSVYFTIEKRHGYINPTVSFAGAKLILEGIREEFYKLIGTKAKVHPYKNKKAHDLKIGTINNFDTIYKYFYEDATLFLGRKKKKFEEILEMI